MSFVCFFCHIHRLIQFDLIIARYVWIFCNDDHSTCIDLGSIPSYERRADLPASMTPADSILCGDQRETAKLLDYECAIALCQAAVPCATTRCHRLSYQWTDVSRFKATGVQAALGNMAEICGRSQRAIKGEERT